MTYVYECLGCFWLARTIQASPTICREDANVWWNGRLVYTPDLYRITDHGGEPALLPKGGPREEDGREKKLPTPK